MGLSESVDLPLLGTALGIGLQGVLNSLYTFVTGVDWGKIGSRIGSCLMNMIHNIDFGTFGALMGSSLTGALNMLHNFIGEIRWIEVGKKIAASLNNFSVQ